MGDGFGSGEEGFGSLVYVKAGCFSTVMIFMWWKFQVFFKDKGDAIGVPTKMHFLHIGRS